MPEVSGLADKILKTKQKKKANEEAENKGNSPSIFNQQKRSNQSTTCKVGDRGLEERQRKRREMAELGEAREMQEGKTCLGVRCFEEEGDKVGESDFAITARFTLIAMITLPHARFPSAAFPNHTRLFLLQHDD